MVDKAPRAKKDKDAAFVVPNVPGLAISEALLASKALQTPFMRQWFAAKERYPDALIFFRMGDFYELFLDDAVRGSQVLGLTLTSRNKGEPDEIPMAGAPHHQAHNYVAKALKAGLSVAIVEQMADPAKCKGIVPREVVRVITPGLVVDETSLDARNNHWLIAIECGLERERDEGVAIAALDHSTGELIACRSADAASALAEVSRLDAKEVLLGPRAHDLLDAVRALAPRAAVRRETEPVDDADALQAIAEHLGGAETATAAHQSSPLARRAVARALRYAQARTPGVQLRVPRLVEYDPTDTLQIDESTVGHLELVRSADGSAETTLLTQLDATRTPAGARLLRRWLLAPLFDVAAIRRRHDAVELFLLDVGLRDALRERLARVGDLERLATRAALGQATPRDLGALRDGLAQLPEIAQVLAGARGDDAREVLGLERPLDVLPDVRAALERALAPSPPHQARDGGIFREGWDATLDELSSLRRNGDAVLLDLEGRLRAQSQIANLKLRFNKVFGWYLEVSKSNSDRVPADWRRKQTVASGERYTTDELDALQDKLLSAEDRHLARELELFGQLRASVAEEGDRLRDVAIRLARWDVLAALADVAHRHDYVRPEVDDGLGLALEEARHPVVERLMHGAQRFVPNDVAVSAEKDADRLLVITGPNMSGKSTLMRQVALACIMAQSGSFVAARRARLGLVDRVTTRVGASDNLARGASTFMVEMRETAVILRRATRRSLIVLDEIGRGTSTYDGLAIAWAVAEHIHDAIGARTLFATHYHELCELAETCAGVANWSVAAREIGDDVVFLHRLVEGGASRSYGIAVARLAGLPEPVLARSRAILASLERGAALPSGAHATMRGRTTRGAVQLDIFGAPPSDEPKAPHPALETLRQVDVDRLSPIEAWQLVAKLKALSSAG